MSKPTHHLCRSPLTSCQYSKYTSLFHYLNNAHIHTLTHTRTGICLSTLKQNKTHITHTSEKAHFNACAEALQGMSDMSSFGHADLRLGLQVKPALWDTQTSASKSERKCRALPVTPSQK